MSATLMWALIATVAEAVALVALQIIDHRRLREYRGTEANHHHSRAGRSARLSGPPNAALGAPPGEGAGPRLDLPVEYRDDAILAWKVALVVWHHGKWRFAGVTVPSFYDADGRAQCERGAIVFGWSSGKVFVSGREPGHHEAPDPTCSCGFYATAERPGVVQAEHGMFLLRVELTGRVIECEHGYRAQRQRVLGVVAPRCAGGWLQAEQCPSTATMVTAEFGGIARPWCSEHAIEATAPPTPLDDVFAGLGVERHHGPDA